MINNFKIKSSHLIWLFQIALVIWFFIGSHKYHVAWCQKNNYYFENYQLLIFSILNLLVILFFPIINNLYLFDKLINKNLIFFLAIIVVIEVYFSMALNALTDSYFLKKYDVPWLMSEEHINSRFFINLSFFCLFTIQKLLQNYIKKSEDGKKLKIGQLESEIKLLRSQIKPHFLFNSLNNIYSYSLQKKDETPDLILKLSEILRFLSDTKNHDFYVDADKEVEIIKNLFGLYLVNKRWINKVEL